MINEDSVCQKQKINTWTKPCFIQTTSSVFYHLLALCAELVKGSFKVPLKVSLFLLQAMTWGERLKAECLSILYLPPCGWSPENSSSTCALISHAPNPCAGDIRTHVCLQIKCKLYSLSLKFPLTVQTHMLMDDMSVPNLPWWRCMKE